MAAAYGAVFNRKLKHPDPRIVTGKNASKRPPILGFGRSETRSGKSRMVSRVLQPKLGPVLQRGGSFKVGG
jgi:hypothetical protein